MMMMIVNSDGGGDGSTYGNDDGSGVWYLSM